MLLLHFSVCISFNGQYFNNHEIVKIQLKKLLTTLPFAISKTSEAENLTSGHITRRRKIMDIPNRGTID